MSHEPAETPVDCRSSAPPPLPWPTLSVFALFLTVSGEESQRWETQKRAPVEKCSPCASSPPDILGPSEGLKDHFLGFDKDFGGPPASQEEDLLL